MVSVDNLEVRFEVWTGDAERGVKLARQFAVLGMERVASRIAAWSIRQILIRFPGREWEPLQVD